MATPLFYDSVATTAKILETNFEHSVETEILLADYEAPVFKIIKTTMEHSISQKYISQGKLTIEGFIKLCVYYQPPKAEKLSVISQKVPFQKQIEVPSDDEQENFITIIGQAQYVNTRAQNPTRVDVRGAYLFNVKAYTRQETKLITAINSKTVCIDDTTLGFFSLAGQTIRQFNLEDELDIQEPTAKILRVETHPLNAAISVYQDKLTVKGEIEAEIFYTQDSSFDVQSYSKAFLYNQIVDIPNMKENYIPYADISVSAFTISQNQDSKKLVANMTARIDVRAFSKQQIIAATDAFSRTFEYEKQNESLLIDSNIYSIEKNIPFLIEDKFNKEYIVSDIIFEISQPRSYFEINKTTVKAKVSAHVIARNIQNEYECFTKSDDLILDWLENCAQYDEIIVNLSVLNYDVSQNEDMLKIKVTISAQGFVMEKQKVEVLHTFGEDTERIIENQEEGLVLYYAQKGEKLFDIAKAHRASPSVIAEQNAITEKQISAPQMLFIPCFEE